MTALTALHCGSWLPPTDLLHRFPNLTHLDGAVLARTEQPTPLISRVLGTLRLGSHTWQGLAQFQASHLELNLMIHDNNDGESHKIVAQRIEELTTVGVMMG